MRPFLICLLAAATSVASGAVTKPNIVLIVADDLGWRDLGCYGSDLHETPHIDRLAAAGVRFTDAYAAAPVCTPTRASILTGEHPARLNMTIWREASRDRGTRQLLEPLTLSDLPLGETTLAEVLHDHGYYTAHIGKWHLGGAASYPESHGFDVNVGGTLWGAPQSFFYPFRGDQYFRDWRYVPGLEPGQPGDYLTDRLTDKALEIIDDNLEQPFLLSLCYYTVHTPIEGKPELVERYAARVQEHAVHTNPDYAAMVHSLDENVGRVLARLDKHGLAEQTIVMFLSDNGGYINDGQHHPGRATTSNRPLRSGKGSLYEGGIRVPWIVRWPGVAPAGGVCRNPVTTCDLYPTLLRGVGLNLPAGQVLDGLDVIGSIRAARSRQRRAGSVLPLPALLCDDNTGKRDPLGELQAVGILRGLTVGALRPAE